MRYLGCGGRDFFHRDRVDAELDAIGMDPEADLVVVGGAPGADTLIEEWARTRRVPFLVHGARWKAYGNRAGPLRNQAMLDRWRPHKVVAFPGGSGTADMVRRAGLAGLPIKIVDM